MITIDELEQVKDTKFLQLRQELSISALQYKQNLFPQCQDLFSKLANIFTDFNDQFGDADDFREAGLELFLEEITEITKIFSVLKTNHGSIIIQIQAIASLASETLGQITQLDQEMKQSRSQSQAHAININNIPIANWIKVKVMKADADVRARSQTQKATDDAKSTISKTIQSIHNLNVYLVPAFEQYLNQMN